MLAPDGKAQTAVDLQNIGHIVVLYLENHSFDNLLGEFPGVARLANAQSVLQRNRDDVR